MTDRIPEPLDAVPRPSASSRRLLVLALVGGLALGGAFVGRYFLYRAADFWKNLDATPLPRKKRDAPFITTAQRVVDKMVEMAEIKSDDLVYDLGCGDGRIVLAAAAKYGCRGVGFDKDPQRVAEARANAQAQGLEGLVTIEEQDIFRVDLSEANVVVMYLLPWMMQDLLPQFDQMRPGSRIISHDFRIEGIEPEQVAEVFNADKYGPSYVIRYVTPLKRTPPPKRAGPAAVGR